MKSIFWQLRGILCKILWMVSKLSWKRSGRTTRAFSKNTENTRRNWENFKPWPELCEAQSLLTNLNKFFHSNSHLSKSQPVVDFETKLLPDVYSGQFFIELLINKGHFWTKVSWYLLTEVSENVTNQEPKRFQKKISNLFVMKLYFLKSYIWFGKFNKVFFYFCNFL